MNCNLGNNLKRLRLAKNYTQEQAAQLLNISPKSLSRWECGSTMPDVMILPEIARLYCVTVDDLYREKSHVYENYASRLLSVYESTHDINDFMSAEREFSKLLKSKEYTMNDLRSYAILYQYLMLNCKEKALQLFQKGLDMGIENDPEVYHQIERQRMLFLSQVGENEKNIEEQTANYLAHPQDLYSHINLIAAYLHAENANKALEIFKQSQKQFSDQPILYNYGGYIYENLKMYDEAFACWDKTLELSCEFVDALWSKAFCYENLSNFTAAYDVWLEIIE